MKLKLSPTAVSILETDVLDKHLEDSDDPFDPIRFSFVDGALVCGSHNSDALADSLNDLSNLCDELAEAREMRDADERKLYRAGSRTFTTLALKARRCVVK